jgi:hypothetical protein
VELAAGLVVGGVSRGWMWAEWVGAVGTNSIAEGCVIVRGVAVGTVAVVAVVRGCVVSK